MNDAVTFEEYFQSHTSLTYKNKGISMLPLLREGHDLFTVTKKGSERCRVGDVVLFRRNGRYILHRVVKVRADSYDCLGDNSVNKEYGVKDSDILGVMESYTRNGKKHPVTAPAYRLYSAVWVRLSPVRITIKRACVALKRRLPRWLKSHFLRAS